MGAISKKLDLEVQKIEFWLVFVIKISIEKNSMKFGLQIEAKKHVPFNIIICAQWHGPNDVFQYSDVVSLVNILGRI
jgi:hypothetical protein